VTTPSARKRIIHGFHASIGGGALYTGAATSAAMADNENTFNIVVANSDDVTVIIFFIGPAPLLIKRCRRATVVARFNDKQRDNGEPKLDPDETRKEYDYTASSAQWL
jgi:hypothetical protein